MDALILASGIGSRMGDKYKTKPKCLLKIYKNLTILDLVLRQLNKINKINKIYIVVGFQKKKIFYHLKKYKKKEINYIINDYYFSKGNYYSALLAEKYINDSFIMLDADIILPRYTIIKLLNNKKQNVILTNQKNIFDKDDIIFNLNSSNEVKNIQIKPKKIQKRKSNIYSSAGVIKISRSKAKIFFKVLNNLNINKKNTKNLYYENAYNELVTKAKFYAQEIRGKRVEIDTPKDLKKIKYIKNFKKKYVQ